VIQLLGIKSNCDIDIRQKFSIVASRLEHSLKSIKNIIGSVVILSTCNRTEVYLDSDLEGEQLINSLFEVLNWDKNLIDNTFYIKDKDAVKHLMEVSCGFHSKIVGEDQILGQIKTAYESAIKAGSVNGKLHRLFQYAVTCGKKFKYTCEIYKIPVSIPSIAVREAKIRNVRSCMIIGFGQIGKLVLKYLNQLDIERIYIVVRDLNKVSFEVKKDLKIKAITFKERRHYYKDVECIFSCTSAPHEIIQPEELPKKEFVIFDLAVPRDVNLNVGKLINVKLYDIDSISKIDEKNKNKRKEHMKKYKYIVQEYTDEFTKWQSICELSPEIQKIKKYGTKISERRIKTFINKRHTKDNEKLVRTMIESTAKAYINRAIDVLKEEKIKGNEEECIKIINRIFCNDNIK
jgi:glutamyl-tRNA reductase